MKRFIWVVLIAVAALPAWGAKKITVAQLGELLHGMQLEKKSDAEAATALKQVELSEELTRAAMNGLVNDVPGPLSTEQIYVLEARSAILPPPAADLPQTAAPDAAAQAEILKKAANYAARSYAQLPRLTAMRTTARFQDNMEAVAAASGMSSAARNLSVGSLSVTPNRFIRYINSTQARVVSRGGTEEPQGKDKTAWGANGLISLQGPGPVLGTVLSDAQAAGHIAFLRWETVNGKAAAVFSYAVDKKKAHYPVVYCCFPDVEQTGSARFGTAGQSVVNPGAGVSGGGNVQTTTEWHSWKATVPYHGELFVDPGTGVVVRLVLQADFKSSDVVHQEDQRIDYAPVNVDGKMLVVPVRALVAAEVVQNGESFAGGGYNTRRILLTSEYKDYGSAR